MNGAQPLLPPSVLSWSVHGQLYYFFNLCYVIGIFTSVILTWPRSSGFPIKFVRGHAVAHLVGTLLQAGKSRVRFPMVSLEFFVDIILPAAL
jgi:hypothetical protein